MGGARRIRIGKAMTRSIHDNNVYGYTVACREQRVTLHTEYLVGDVREFTDVVFSGVIAHRFENQLSGNILLDIEESDLAGIVRAEPNLFEQLRELCWPKGVKASSNDEWAIT